MTCSLLRELPWQRLAVPSWAYTTCCVLVGPSCHLCGEKGPCLVSLPSQSPSSCIVAVVLPVSVELSRELSSFSRGICGSLSSSSPALSLSLLVGSRHGRVLLHVLVLIFTLHACDIFRELVQNSRAKKLSFSRWLCPRSPLCSGATERGTLRELPSNPHLLSYALPAVSAQRRPMSTSSSSVSARVCHIKKPTSWPCSLLVRERTGSTGASILCRRSTSSTPQPRQAHFHDICDSCAHI